MKSGVQRWGLLQPISVLGSIFISNSANQLPKLNKKTNYDEQIGEANQHQELTILPSWHRKCDIWPRMTNHQNPSANYARHQCQDKSQQENSSQIPPRLLDVW
jgi:hypothetical protein